MICSLFCEKISPEYESTFVSVVFILMNLYCRVFSDVDIVIYPPEGDPPASWWDEECDKSLLMGVYKYG